jgi:predicted permease
MPFFARKVPPGVRRILRLPWSRARLEQDLDDELRFHLDARAADIRALGMSDADAMAEAERQFGDLATLRHDVGRAETHRARRRRAIEWMHDVWQDIRYAARGLARRPGFSVAAIVCLAIGIGANATMFGVVDALLLRPPAAVRDPGSVVWINVERADPDDRQWQASRGAALEPLGVSYPDYADFSRVSALEGVAAYSGGDRKLGRGADARRVNTLFITHPFMPLLGASAALGRFFSADEDGDSGPRVVVLGYAFWQSDFAGSADALGKTVLIDDKPYSVIGVAPRDFNGVERSTVDVYLPVAVLADLNRTRSRPFPLADRRFDAFSIVGRIPHGARREQLAKELNVTYHQSDAVDADRAKRHVVVASPMSLTAMPNLRQVQNVTVSLWLYGVAGIVLLIACADVAALLITRGVGRRREIAVRLALGVGRRRLVRLLLTESALLAAAGCVAGLLLARWGGSVIRATLLSEMDAGSARLDWRVLVVTLVTAVFTGLACGLAPALMATRPNLSTVLKSGERDGIEGRGRTGGVLLIGQVALTLVLLVGAGLFVRSLQNLDATDFGFDVRHVLFANVGDSAYTTPQADERFRDLIERTRALPGVEHVAMATSGPFGIMWIKPIYAPGHEGDWPPPRLSAVTPDFFETLGITLQRGRRFTAADDAGAERVAIVNEEMARHYWPQGDVLGQCIRIGGERAPCRRVVGIMHNARQGDWPDQPIQTEHPMSAYYIPFAQRDSDTSTPGRAILYVRSAGNATGLAPAVRRTLRATFPDLPASDAIAFSTPLARQFRPWRLGASMFGIFGGMALALAIVGLYGVLAFRVSQRTHEIGVRVALGAQSSDVRRLVVGHGVRLGAIGVTIGIGTTLAVAHFLDGILFGVSSRDPYVLAVVAGTLLVVAAVASHVPAFRASRIDPMQALREL